MLINERHLSPRHAGYTMLLAFVITLVVPACTRAQTPTSGFNPTLVMKQFGLTDPNLRLVVSHRGIWQGVPNCAENTHCSIKAAYDAGVEAVEIDVKSSTDGTLWAFHDQTVGRLTEYKAPGCTQLWDPAWVSGTPTAGHPNPPAGCTNPTFTSMSDLQIQSLYLRNPMPVAEGGYVPSIRLYTLSSLLDNSPAQQVVMLDLKTLSDVQTAVTLTGKKNLIHKVIFKFPSALINPNIEIEGGIPTFLKGVNWTVTVGASDLLRIIGQSAPIPPGASQTDAQDSVNLWFQQLLYPPYQALNLPKPPIPLYVELRLKSNGYTEQEPLRATWDYLTSASGPINDGTSVAVSVFSPTPDVSPDFFYRDWADGGGYYTLSDVYTTNIAPFPNETSDHRESQAFVLEYDNSVITDQPVSLIQYANQNGPPSGGSYRAHVSNLCYNQACPIVQ